MQCVTTVTYSFKVNGKTTVPFHAKRGVRQGDPLSPFLFVLAMNYLTRILKTLHGNPKFQFHPRCKKQKIMQLSFADDFLFFCKGDIQSVKCLYDCFKQFSEASGLVENIEKSNVYFGGVQQTAQDQILQELRL